MTSSSRLSLCVGLLIAEFIFCVAVVCAIPYTEIDWKAYMQEVEGFLSGELDYYNLRGDTGPLVYPGGFVLLFSALYFITFAGQSLLIAQSVFLGLHVATLGCVLQLYASAGVPVVYWFALFLSKRIRSLYVLRLFNDCVAMGFLYFAVATMVKANQQRKGGLLRWLMGCFLFSMAVSVKMNVLLFAPGLLHVLIATQRSTWRVLLCLGVCALWQVLVGLPFLLSYPMSYINKGFELSRVFTYKWTVNFRFLPEEVFVSKPLGVGLLVCTLLSWVIVYSRRWRHRSYALADPPRPSKSKKNSKKADDDGADGDDAESDFETSVELRNIILTLFESNLIGVAFSRTMHYQFFTWIFHQIPFALYFTNVPFVVQAMVFAGINYGFEVYPSTPLSSAVLMTSVAVLLAGILFSTDPEGTPKITGARKRNRSAKKEN